MTTRLTCINLLLEKVCTQIALKRISRNKLALVHLLAYFSRSPCSCRQVRNPPTNRNPIWTNCSPRQIWLRMLGKVTQLIVPKKLLIRLTGTYWTSFQSLRRAISITKVGISKGVILSTIHPYLLAVSQAEGAGRTSSSLTSPNHFALNRDPSPSFPSTKSTRSCRKIQFCTMRVSFLKMKRSSSS